MSAQAAATRSRGVSRRRDPRRRVLALQRTALVVLLVALWEGVTAAHLVDPLTLPPPYDVLKSFGTIITTGKTLSGLAVTMEQALLGVAIALVVGAVIGFMAWRYKWFRSAVVPWLAVANAVPGLLFYPVAIVLIGLGTGSIVALSALLGCFTVSELMLAGLRDVRPVFLELASSLEAGRMTVLRKVMLPASFTILVSAIRVTFTIVFITVIASQYILSGVGIGYELHFAYESFETNKVYAFVLLIMVVSLLCQFILVLLLGRLRGRNAISQDAGELAKAPI